MFRIIFVCNEYPPERHGGIGIFVKTMAEALAERGVKVAVFGFCSSVKEDHLAEENGVSVMRLYDPYLKRKDLRLGRFVLPIAFFKRRNYLSCRLKVFINDFKADLVESFDWAGPLLYPIDVPLVIRMHGAHTALNFSEKRRTSFLLKLLEGHNLRIASSLCAVSNHIGAMTSRAFRKRYNYEVIHNFVDCKFFTPQRSTKRNNLKILYVGRLDQRKGLIELFTILQRLFQMHHSVFCELVGHIEPAFKSKLLAILDKSYHDRIHFVGRVPHAKLPEIYSTAGICVMPSRAEAFGLTAIEAMACNGLVIVTDRASGPEIVTDAVNGFLLNFNDTDLAAAKIFDIVKKLDSFDSIRLNARKHVEKSYSLELMVIKNIGFYKKALARG